MREHAAEGYWLPALPAPLLVGLGCVNPSQRHWLPALPAPLRVGLGRVNTEPKALAAGTAGPKALAGGTAAPA